MKRTMLNLRDNSDLQDIKLYQSWLQDGSIHSSERRSFINAIEYLKERLSGNKLPDTPTMRYRTVLNERAERCDKASNALINSLAFENYVRADDSPEGVVYRITEYVNSGAEYAVATAYLGNNIYNYINGAGKPSKAKAKTMHKLLKRIGY